MIRAKAVVLAMAVFLPAAGCATTIPPELLAARGAYQTAQRSPGAGLAQADMYEAQKSLQRAEKSFEDAPDTQETKDLAYVAHRKAIAAQARGGAMVAAGEKTLAEKEATQWKDMQGQAMKLRLGASEDALAAGKVQAAVQDRALEAERQGRAAAEQRARDMLEKLSSTPVRQDPRGLVVTLSGSVIFASGKSALLPGANARLDEVARALKEDPRTVTVVGHTDSTGDDAMNMTLSQTRAQAVRSYLVSKGVPASSISATGMGKSQPIADNASVEGRANNRRVELILEERAPTPVR